MTCAFDRDLCYYLRTESLKAGAKEGLGKVPLAMDSIQY